MPSISAVKNAGPVTGKVLKVTANTAKIDANTKVSIKHIISAYRKDM